MTETQRNILCELGYTNDKTDGMSKRIPFDETKQGPKPGTQALFYLQSHYKPPLSKLNLAYSQIKSKRNTKPQLQSVIN